MSSNPAHASTLLHEALSKRALELDSSPPQEVLEWAAGEYAPHLVLACSFGSASDMMLLDLVVRIDRTLPILYIDTEVLFPETYELIATVQARYGITPRALKFSQSPPDELWLTKPDECCHLRKVAPLREALAGYQGWITGLRRDQGGARRNTPVVAWDEVFGLVKVNPLASVSEDEAWAYVREHNVPYNLLHDQGYPSIGCLPCTRPVRPGDPLRAGRWQGMAKTECGLHRP